MGVNFWTLAIIFTAASAASASAESPLPTYSCVGGKNPASMSKKEYLVEFAKGPCNPVMLIPAMLTTKLLVEIPDCEKFRKAYPDTFKTCGFTDCVKQKNEFWKKVPKKEYLMWVPRLGSPMDFYSVSHRHGWCWAKILAKEIDFSKPLEDAIIENDVFKIKIWGHTEGTKNDTTCGEFAVSDLAPFKVQVRLTVVWGAMIRYLKAKGYVTGLTFQSVPFDWGRTYRNNQLKHLFRPNLERLHNLTNKKVVLVTQSYGNKNTYAQILRIELENRQKWIKAWVSLGFASLGSQESQASLVGGSDYFAFANKLVGVSSGASTYFATRIACMYEVSAIDPFTLYRGQKWFEAFQKRMDYESGKIPFEESGFAFLPKKEDTCSPELYFWGPKCLLRLSNTESTPIVQIQNKAYYTNETERLFREWGQDETLLKWYNIMKDPEYEKLANPKVPVVAVILRQSPTASSFIFHEDVKQAVKEDRFPKKTVIYSPGDGTVTTNSMYAGPLKWAWEFDNSREEGMQPIKIVDMCGVYEPKITPYDEKDPSGEHVMTKNQFFGLECDCLKQPNTNDCIHAVMGSDSGVLKLIENTAQAHENGYNENYQKYIDGLTDDYLADITERCVQLDYHRGARNYQTLEG